VDDVSHRDDEQAGSHDADGEHEKEDAGNVQGR